MWVTNSNFYFPSRKISDKLHFRSFLFNFFVFGPVLFKNRNALGGWGQTDEMHLFAFSAPLYFQGSGPFTFYLGKVELHISSLQSIILLKALLASPHFAGTCRTAPPSLSVCAAEARKCQGEAHCKTRAHHKDLYFPLGSWTL